MEGGRGRVERVAGVGGAGVAGGLNPSASWVGLAEPRVVRDVYGVRGLGWRAWMPGVEGTATSLAGVCEKLYQTPRGLDPGARDQAGRWWVR